ncbi:MAG: Type pantothenate kinase, partial [Pseudomonadota bacterium]
LLVVSAGTATVIDGLRLTLDSSANRCLEFLGGYISPGLLQLQTVLARGTADLGALMRGRDLPQKERRMKGFIDWPTESAEAIAAGVEMAQLAPLAWIPRPDGILVHGGAAQEWMDAFGRRVARHWNCPVEHCPDLIFRGLRQALADSFDID